METVISVKRSSHEGTYSNREGESSEGHLIDESKVRREEALGEGPCLEGYYGITESTQGSEEKTPDGEEERGVDVVKSTHQEHGKGAEENVGEESIPDSTLALHERGVGENKEEGKSEDSEEEALDEGRDAARLGEQREDRVDEGEDNSVDSVGHHNRQGR